MVLLGSSVSVSSAETRRVFRDAATHESLAGQKKQPADPISVLVPNEMPVPQGDLEPFKPTSLIARSEILHARGAATLVPKRAILHLPAGLKGAHGMPKGSPKILNWRDFYVANRSWIDTVEVTRAQAEGRAPLSEKLVESFEECRKVVVAVYQAGPISVLPLAEPVEEDPEEAESAETDKENLK